MLVVIFLVSSRRSCKANGANFSIEVAIGSTHRPLHLVHFQSALRKEEIEDAISVLASFLVTGRR